MKHQQGILKRLGDTDVRCHTTLCVLSDILTTFYKMGMWGKLPARNLQAAQKSLWIAKISYRPTVTLVLQNFLNKTLNYTEILICLLPLVSRPTPHASVGPPTACLTESGTRMHWCQRWVCHLPGNIRAQKTCRSVWLISNYIS